VKIRDGKTHDPEFFLKLVCNFLNRIEGSLTLGNIKFDDSCKLGSLRALMSGDR
jgi:hypothetical protein